MIDSNLMVASKNSGDHSEVSGQAGFSASGGASGGVMF